MDTKDLYAFINNSIRLKGYAEFKEITAEDLKEEIKQYIIFKIHYKEIKKQRILTGKETIQSMLNFFEKLYKEDLNTLFKLFEEKVVTNKYMNMANFIHCILMFISLIQEWEVIWQIEDNQNEPIFKESVYAPGKLDALVTTKEIDYLTTFNYCLDTLDKISLNRGRN